MTKSPILILVSGLLANLSLVAASSAPAQHLVGHHPPEARQQQQQQQQPGLHSLAQAAGMLFFGTATDTNNFNDTAYMQIVNNKNEFGLLVPENSQKWQPTEPTQGDFVFTGPDAVRALAVTNGQMFRCHTLTWFQQLPQFVLTTSWTPEALTAVIESHIANVVGHYAGACYSWDVVNEALNDGNGTFRSSVFFNTLGAAYIPLSFRAAAAADPRAKLYYNDFSLEFNGDKTEGALEIVRLVNGGQQQQQQQNSSSSPGLIQGVGFQGHFTVGGTPSQEQLVAVFNRFLGEPGVQEIAITELDIRHPPGTAFPADASALAQQARDYTAVVGACLAVGGARCVGVVVWQFTDRYSWVPGTFAGAGEACLYDAALGRKPAWTSVAAQLAAAAAAATADAAPTGAGVGGAAGGSGIVNVAPSPTSAGGFATNSGSSGRRPAAGNNGTSGLSPSSSPKSPVQVGGGGGSYRLVIQGGLVIGGWSPGLAVVAGIMGVQVLALLA